RAQVSSRRSATQIHHARKRDGCDPSDWFARYLISHLNLEACPLTLYFSSPGSFPRRQFMTSPLTHKRLWKGMKDAILQSPLMQARLDADVYRPSYAVFDDPFHPEGVKEQT